MRVDLQSESAKDNDQGVESEDVGNADSKANDHGQDAQPRHLVSHSISQRSRVCRGGIADDSSAQNNRRPVADGSPGMAVARIAKLTIARRCLETRQ